MTMTYYNKVLSITEAGDLKYILKTALISQQNLTKAFGHSDHGNRPC